MVLPLARRLPGVVLVHSGGAVMASDDFFSHVDRRMWGDAKVKALEPDEKLVWCWLLNNTQHTQVPGVFRCWAPMISDETGLPLRRTRKCIAKLAEFGMLQHDERTGLTWLPNALKRRTVRSPDNVRAWKRDFGALPECQLKQAIAQTFAETLSTRSDKHAEAWRNVVGSDGPDSTKTRTSDTRETDHIDPHNQNEGGTENKDQEKDKDQEQEQGAPTAPHEALVGLGKTPFQRDVIALLAESPDLQADRPAPDWQRGAAAIEANAMTKSSPKRVLSVLPYVLDRLAVLRASSPREGGARGGMGFVLDKLAALTPPGALEADQSRHAAPAERSRRPMFEVDDDDIDLDALPRVPRVGP